MTEGVKGVRNFSNVRSQCTDGPLEKVTLCIKLLDTWAEIHQLLLSHFSHLVEFFIVKVPSSTKIVEF